jgi:hypothetical protein
MGRKKGLNRLAESWGEGSQKLLNPGEVNTAIQIGCFSASINFSPHVHLEIVHLECNHPQRKTI